MIADLDLVELEVRQLPGVAAVSFDNEPDEAVVIQLLVCDPRETSAVKSQAERLVTRRLEVPTVVEVFTAGAPSGPLAFERDVPRVDGVRSCTAERGPRGEVRKVTVSVIDESVVEPARRRLTAAMGSRFPDERVIFEIRSA